MRIIENQKVQIVLLLVSLLCIFNIGISEAAKPIKPSTPTNLTVTYSSGRYYISWIGIASTSSGYELSWQRLENGHWRWLSHGRLIEPGSSRSWVLHGASQDDVLRFAIRAVSGKSKSRWTDWVVVGDAGQNKAPVASAGADQTVDTGSTVSLNGSSSSDPDGDAISFQWMLTQIPAGSSTSLSSSIASSPNFNADQPGIYIASLVVNDGNVSSNADTVTITAVTQNTKPVANAGADQSVIVGRLVTLDGTRSSDSDGDNLIYNWQISLRPLNSQVTLVSPSSSSPGFTPDMAGQYKIDLVVNDGKESSTPDQLIVDAVTNSLPVANVGSNQTVAPGQTVTLDGSASYDQDGDLLIFKWSLIEKPVGSLASLTDSSIESPTFTANLSGQYVVQLIVNDGFDNSEPVTVIISATSLKLTLLSPQDFSATSNRHVTVTGTIEDVDPNNKNIGIRINNQLAIIDRSVTPFKFIARVPLITGEQKIYIMAATQTGESISKMLTITRNAGSTYSASIEPTSGAAPLSTELSLSLSDPYNNVFVKAFVDFDDDGFDDFTYDGIEYTPEGNIIVTPMDLSQTISFTYTKPGIYQAKVKLLDFVSLNNQGTALTEHIVPVEVISETLDESLFTAIWDGMNAAVLAGNIPLAETAFSRGSRKKFSPLLTALQPHYQEIIDSYTDWKVVTNSPGYKEFVLNRTMNGENRVYFVTFIRDQTGVWRITSM
ncbi:MAG: hypothetical protein KAJ95_04545 [Gammaproteobacteria bacterium]|nr:hypothetical protein [Gammaproteobacteria bacterium]